jgi:hypothetical protein
MFKRLVFSMMLLTVSGISSAQNDSLTALRIGWPNILIDHYDSISKRHIVQKSICGTDTILYDFISGKYRVISSAGILLIDGHGKGGLGTECGCQPMADGSWIEHHPNGKLKAIGSNRCGQKTGRWTTFFDNGNVAKIENYYLVYPDAFTARDTGWDTLPRRIYMLNGPYLEYYPNGNLKTEGAYMIVEKHSTSQIGFTFDSITYEEKEFTIKGDFWLPATVKNGSWEYYEPNGRIARVEEYLPELDGIKRRSLADRYRELMSRR